MAEIDDDALVELFSAEIDHSESKERLLEAVEVVKAENQRLRDALVVILDAADMYDRDSDEYEKAWRYSRAALLDEADNG